LKEDIYYEKYRFYIVSSKYISQYIFQNIEPKLFNSLMWQTEDGFILLFRTH